MTSRGGTVPAHSQTGVMSTEGGASARVVVSDVFVSPRVIDRRAYSELSSELRELIAHAASERLNLVSHLDQAGRASEDFRSREAAQAVNLDLCAKAIRRIDERAARVETVLSQASDVGKIIATIEEKTAHILESKLQSMEARAQAIQAAATAHTQALEERLKRATRELEQRIEAIRRDGDAIVGPSAEKLEGLCTRAILIMGNGAAATQTGPADTSLAGLIARAEGIAEKTQGAIDHMDRVRTQAETEKAELDAWITRGHERLDEIQARWKQVDALSAELAGRSQTSIEELRSRLEKTASVIRSTLDQAITAAQTAGEGAVSSIRLAGEAALGDTQRLLSELSDKMVYSRLELQQMAQQIDERTSGLRLEADHLIRATLDQAATAAQTASESAGASIRLAGEAAMGDTQRLLSELNDKMVSSRLEVQQIARQIDERTTGLRSDADRIIAEVKPQADSATAGLLDAVHQSHAAHNTTGLALKLLEKASVSAGQMLERLRPWEGVLTGDQERMPEPIAKIIEGVRREVHGDLSSIATALRDAAGRAERAGDALAGPATGTAQPSGRYEIMLPRVRVDLAQSAD